MKIKKYFNKLVSILLVSCMLATMLPTFGVLAAETETEVFFQDFEGTVDFQGTPSGAEVVTVEGNKVLEIIDRDDSTIAKANFSFAPQSGQITISYKMYVVADIEGTEVSTLQDFSCGSKENSGSWCTAKKNQILMLKTSAAKQQLQFQGRGESGSKKSAENAYAVGDWTEVKLVLDTDAGTFEVFADGVSCGTANLCYTSDSTATGLDQIDNLAFFTETAGAAHTYIDDVKVTKKTVTVDPEPVDPPAGEDAVFFQDFEGTVDYASTPTGTTQVIDLDGNKVLEMADNDTGSTVAKANFKFTDAEGNLAPQSGQITISYKMYVVADVEGTPVDTVLDFSCGSKENSGGWCTAKTRQILMLKTSAAKKQLQFQGRGESGSKKSAENAYAVGDWTEVKLVLDTDAGTFEVFADGVSQGTANLCYTSDSTATSLDQIDNIAFFTEGATAAHAYIDDVKVTVKSGEEPGPDPVDPDPVDPDPVEGTAVFSQDFEGTVDFQGTPTGAEVVTVEGGKVLEITDADSTTAKAVFSFPAQSGEITVSFRVNVLDDNSTLYMGAGSHAVSNNWATSSAGRNLRLTFNSANANHQLQYQSGGAGSGETMGEVDNSFQVNGWTQVKVVLDTQAKTFRVWSGDTDLGGTALTYTDAALTDQGQVDNIAFFTNTSKLAHAYIDDVQVTVKSGETPGPGPDVPKPGATEYWTPTQSGGETFTTTTDQVIATLPVSGVTMAVGAGTWTVTDNKDTTLNGVTYTKHINADKSPKVSAGTGEYFKFTIPAEISAGELVVALRVNTGRKLFVLEDDAAMAGYEDPEAAPVHTETAAKLAVVGGKTYTVYVESSMAYFYGFSFRPVDKEADIAAFQAELDKLDFNWIRGENTDANAVDKDLYLTTSWTSPGFGACDVNWTSDSVAVANNGVVNRLAEDTTVTLTANISVQQISYLNLNKDFVVKVTALTDDAEAVAGAKAALDLGGLSAVKKDLVLPAEGKHGTTVTWVSSDPDVVTVDETNHLGVIHPNDTAAQTVTLTATITRGSVTDTKEFEVTVAAAKILDVNSWAYTTAAGEAHFAPTDGGKLHSINVTNNNQHLDTNDYQFKVEILDAQGAVKSTSAVKTASAFFTHGVGVSEYLELDMAMDSGDSFRVTAYDDTKTYVNFTHCAADETLAPGAKIYVIGDSTAAVYDNNKYPQTGWAQVLEGFFDGVEVVDLAIPGRSSLDYKTRQQFEDLKRDIRPGDYLIIQFGHNDSHNADASIYTDPNLGRFDEVAPGETPSYKKCMAEYVTLAWDAGAYPIIATSISRRKLADTTGELYGNAAKALAAELSIPCVDVLAATNAWVNKVGLTESIDMFNIIKPQDSRFYNDPEYKDSTFWNGNNAVEANWDNTHVNRNGAKLIAMYAADGIAELGVPLGTKRNAVTVSETLPHYADAISGPPPVVTKTPAETGCIDFEAGGWKLQLPVEDPNKQGSVLEKSPSELAAGYHDDYFYADADDAGDYAVVFHTPVDGFKTANTSYTRSELREMLDPTDKTKNWGWEGTHTLTAEQRVTHVSARGQVITSQIHGIEQNGDNANPLVKVRYVYDAAASTGKVVVDIKETTASDSADVKHTFDNVPLGQKYKTVIQVVDGVVSVTVSTVEGGQERSETFTKDFVAADENWKNTLYYFKVGSYIQDNEDTSAQAYADVWTYSAGTSHQDGGEELPPPPLAGTDQVTVTAGGQAVSNKYTVSGTGNKALSFTVTPNATGDSQLKGGVKFFVDGAQGEKTEILRFKLDNGKFKLAEVNNGTPGTYTTLGTYTDGTTYSLKLVLIPKAESAASLLAAGADSAKVRVCQVEGETETQLGEDFLLTDTDLSEITMLDFFADSGCEGTLAFTDVVYETGVELEPEPGPGPDLPADGFAQDFEGEVVYEGNHTGAEVIADGGNKVLEIVDTDTAADSTASRANFTFAPLNGEITIAFRLKVLAEDTMLALTCGSSVNTSSQCTSKAGEFLRLKTLTSKKFQYRGGNGTGVTADNYTYDLNQWIDVKVVVDTGKGTFSAYADDTLLGSAALSNDTTTTLTDIDNIAFLTEKAGTGHVYVDDVSVTVKDSGDEPDPVDPPKPSTELPSSLTVTAAESTVTHKYPVTTGEGNTALRFTVTPSATEGLSGGVKFYSQDAEMVRFKLDGGTFKIGEFRKNPETEKSEQIGSYVSMGAYEAGKAYAFKLVLVPSAGEDPACVYVCLEDRQIGALTLTQGDPTAIDDLRFFTDSNRSGTLTYTGISYESGVEFEPETGPEPAPSEYLLKTPSAWTLGEGAAIANEKLTIQAGEASSNSRIDVSGDGVKTLSFTVAVDVDDVKNLKAGVNFRDAEGNTVLRFKLQNGGLRLSDMSVDSNDKTVYELIGGSFAKKSTFQVKLELFPATETRDAYVRVYKDGKIVCNAFSLSGENAATLESITRLYFFTDSNSSGTLTYSDMIYRTGPKTPAQTLCIDFVLNGWKLRLAQAARGAVEKSAQELAEGYFDEHFYADADATGADAVVLHYPSAELRETTDWKCDGSNTLTLEQSVPRVGAGGQAVTAQVLAADETPIVQVRYVYDAATQTGKVVAEGKKAAQSDAESVLNTFPDVALGQKFSTVIQAGKSGVDVTFRTTGADGAERREIYSYRFAETDSAWRDGRYTFTVGDCAPADGDGDVWVYGATVEHKTIVPASPSGPRPSTSTSDYSDGGSTVVETWANGTVVTTQTASNGDTMRTEQNPDGTVRIVVKAENGDATVTVDADGKTQAKVTVSETAAAKAQQAGTVLTLPVPQLTAGKDLAGAPTVEIAKRPGSELLVNLPVKQPGQGTVPVAVHPDGTQEIIKMSVPTPSGVIFRISGDETVKLVDNARAFADVPSGHWAAGAVDFASGRELLVGTGENLFSPDGVTTRATVVTILARMDGTDTSGGETWYAKGMDWATAHGVSDGTAPEALISREQFVTMLYRYGGQPAVTGNAPAGFADSAAVSSWASSAMTWATQTGIMRGRPDGTLDPAGTATRAEAATLFMRYCMWSLGVPLDVSAPSAGAEATVALDMDFDAEALGRSWAQGTKVTELDGRRVVEITDTSTTKNTALNYLFAPQAGKVTISFKMYIDPADADSVLVMSAGSRAQTGKYSSTSAGEFMRLKTVSSSKKFQFRGGDSAKTGSVNAGSYRCGEWIELKVVVDTDAGTFAAYADGELLGENQPLSNKGITRMKNIDNITFMTEKAGLGRAYIDDVKVTGQVRQFSIWDESVDSRVIAVGAAGDDLLSGAAQWQLKQGEIADGTLSVLGGEDSASNKVAVSGTGNKVLSFTVVSDNETGAKGGVRFLSQGEEVLRFKLDGGKLKLSDMRTDESGKTAYENLGAYSADTAYEVRLLLLDKTADQKACVKAYVNGQQAGSTYALSDTAAAALTEVTQLNFFTDKNTAGTLTYSDMTYRTGVDAPADVSVPGGATPPSGDTPAGTGCIDFLKDGWKIQLPVENPAKAGSVLEKSPQELADGYTDEYFYAAVDEQGTPAVVFHSPVKGFKTGNTSYARSELRELIDPSDSKVNWTWQGTHTLETEERVTHVPASGQVITSQIHGIEQNGDNANPLVKVRYVYEAAKGTGKVVVELKNTTSPTSYDFKYNFPNVALGQKYKTQIQVFDGAACVTISTTDPDGAQRSETYRHDFVAADPYWKETWYYFKLGNYIQDNKDESDGAYADVWVYSSSITHSDSVEKIPVSAITMDQSAVSIRSGERTGLSVSAAPIKAYDKSVTWAVTAGSDVAAVDKDGFVTGLKEGTATVTATSVSNSAATASCTVTVKDEAVVEVKPVFAVDFGTDAARTDPAGYGGAGCEITADAPANTGVAVVNENGSNLVTLRDDATDAPAKLSFVFAPQTDTTTIAFRVRIDALGEHQVGKADFGRMYLVAAGSDSWYTNDTELFRIRNSAKGTLGSFSGLTYVLTDHYDEITMNADKVMGGYGDWVDVVYVVTPNNGTAKANTTDVYMNGYPVALAVANRNTVDYVNRLDVQTGTEDTLTFSLDDVKVYTGIVLPENTELVKPASLELVRVPGVMAVTDSAQAAVEVAPAEGYEKVRYSVASGDAVCVSDDGYVTAIRPGVAEVRAESVLDSAVFAQKTVTVQESVIRPQSLRVPGAVHVAPGGTEQLQVAVLPENATEKGVKYEIVSGGEVAGVDSWGLVTGKTVGTASIRVTSLSDPAVFATVPVSVTRTLTPGEVIFAEDFTAGELDSARWSVSLAKDNTFVEMKDGAMTLIDANTAANPKVTLDFSPVSGKVSIQFKVKVDGEVTIQGGSVKSTGYRNQRIAFGSGNITATANESFCLRGNGTHFTYNTSGANYVEIPGDYDVAQWNELTLVTTVNADGPDTTDVYINGVKALSGAANKVDYPAIDKLCFSADTANVAAFSIDDLAIWAGDYGDKPADMGAARFGDVPAGHWAREAIAFACDRGLMAGVGGGAFAPDATTTRATVVTVLARLDGADTAGGETWYSKATEWAVAKGVSDGSDPDGLISREQFVTMLYRCAGQPQSAGTLSAFADGAAVSAWARPAMEWAVSNGLMQGRADGTLDPTGTTTRAEAAALLMRYCQWSENAR